VISRHPMEGGKQGRVNKVCSRGGGGEKRTECGELYGTGSESQSRGGVHTVYGAQFTRNRRLLLRVLSPKDKTKQLGDGPFASVDPRESFAGGLLITEVSFQFQGVSCQKLSRGTKNTL